MYVYIERYIFHARIHRHRPIGGDRSIKSRISRRSLSDASGLDIQSVGGDRRGNIFIARRKRCPEVCCDAAHGQRRHARPLIDIKLAGKWPVIRNNERQSVFRVILLDHRERGYRVMYALPFSSRRRVGRGGGALTVRSSARERAADRVSHVREED